MASQAQQFPPSYVNANYGPRIVAADLVVGIAATIAVALRLVARRLKELPPGADDYAMMVGLVSLTQNSKLFQK